MTPARIYGPHRPEDVPATVTVQGFGKWPQEIQIPYPKALAEQRRQINELARRG